MRYGIIECSKEFLDSDLLPPSFEVKRKEPSMSYAGSFELLVESDLFREVNEGDKIPKYELIGRKIGNETSFSATEL